MGQNVDDESYFTLRNYNMSDNNIFYSNDLSITPLALTEMASTIIGRLNTLTNTQVLY